MARVLWYGDAGSHSGFARVTHSIAQGLVEHGHEVHVFAISYPGDWMPELEGLRVWRGNQTGDDRYGARNLLRVVDQVEPDVTIMLHDPAVAARLLFRNPVDPHHEVAQAAPVITYMAVDGYNYPAGLIDPLTQYTNPVVMAKHGLSVFPGAQLVHHGVDTKAFYPVESSPTSPVLDGEALHTKAACKRALGFDPDKKLVLRVDSNSGRKDYAASILALGPILEKDRDVQVYFHAATDSLSMGCDLVAVLARFDIELGQVRSLERDYAGFGWDQHKLNVLYNAADVFLTTTRGEGFGLTIAEALACGVPVIAQAVSSIPEVVGPGGWLLQPERPITVPAGHDLWLPNIGAFTDQIASVLAMSNADRRDVGEAGRKHVSQFRWEPAQDRFHDFVQAFA